MLELKNVSVTVGKTKILDGICLCPEPQALTVLIGRNAAGKSTLLSCLTGERKYTGTISFGEKDLSELSKKERSRLLSVMPQKLPSPDISGGHLIRLGRTPYLDIGRRFTDEDKKECETATELTGTRELLGKKVSLMSGGERQKIFLAMLLAQNTPFVAFDEPTSYMDARHEREFSSLISDIVKRQKKTALVVMHDLTRAVEIADNIAIMEKGRIIFHGSSRDAAESGIIERAFDVKCYDCGGLKIYR